MADRACEHCGKALRVLLAMKPGGDGKVWFLCPRCWVDGLSTKKPIVERAQPVVSAEMGDALKKSGWKVTDAPTSATVTKTKRRAERS